MLISEGKHNYQVDFVFFANDISEIDLSLCFVCGYGGWGFDVARKHPVEICFKSYTSRIYVL